jgi:hypothetical protein
MIPELLAGLSARSVPSTIRDRRSSKLARRTAGVVVALGLLLCTGSAAASTDVYHVWCGDWDANPFNPPATVVGGINTVPLKDGAIATLQWGNYLGHEYVWAKLVNAPVGDHLALWWEDNQNHARYQCGDSHGYDDATVWSNTSETWTGGVPITPPRSGDAVAVHEGYFVWNNQGQNEYPSPQFSLKPWPNPSPSPSPSPSPNPPPPGPSGPPSSGPPTVAPPPPGLGCKPAVDPARLTLFRAPGKLHNGHRVHLWGRPPGLSVPAGIVVLLRALENPHRHTWITFGAAITNQCGRFSYWYRFTRTTTRCLPGLASPPGCRVRYYSLRALVPFQAGYVLGPVFSRPVVVGVIGARNLAR